MAKEKILVIVGPTASGKSDLGVKLAKKFGGGIISADSRQVYKGLDVGTGKITKKEMGGIPHHLLDIANPKKRFSVSDFLTLTNQAIAKIVESDKLPVVVGGTGFYIDALTGTVTFPEVPPNPALRKKLEKKSVVELFKLLGKKDPERAKTIDRYNKVRLIRALEIINTLGHVPMYKIGQPGRVANLRYEFIYIGLKPDKKESERRIYERLLKRLPGMIREAKKLWSKGLSYKRMNELGLEYRYLALFLQNKLNKEQLINKLNIAIRQYAKRQMTWFKRNKKIKWFTLSAVEGFEPKQYREIEKYTRNMLR